MTFERIYEVTVQMRTANLIDNYITTPIIMIDEHFYNDILSLYKSCSINVVSIFQH